MTSLQRQTRCAKAERNRSPAQRHVDQSLGAEKGLERHLLQALKERVSGSVLILHGSFMACVYDCAGI